MDNLMKVGLMLLVGLMALKVVGWLFSNLFFYAFAFAVGYFILKYWGKHKHKYHKSPEDKYH